MASYNIHNNTAYFVVFIMFWHRISQYHITSITPDLDNHADNAFRALRKNATKKQDPQTSDPSYPFKVKK